MEKEQQYQHNKAEKIKSHILELEKYYEGLLRTVSKKVDGMKVDLK